MYDVQTRAHAIKCTALLCICPGRSVTCSITRHLLGQHICHNCTRPKVSSPGDDTCSDSKMPPVTQTLAKSLLGAGPVKVCVTGRTSPTLHVSSHGLLRFGRVRLRQTPSTGLVRRLYDLRLRCASQASIAFMHQLPVCSSKSKPAYG
jgi:hypothetical protein